MDQVKEMMIQVSVREAMACSLPRFLCLEQPIILPPPLILSGGPEDIHRVASVRALRRISMPGYIGKEFFVWQLWGPRSESSEASPVAGGGWRG